MPRTYTCLGPVTLALPTTSTTVPCPVVRLGGSRTACEGGRTKRQDAKCRRGHQLSGATCGFPDGPQRVRLVTVIPIWVLAVTDTDTLAKNVRALDVAVAIPLSTPPRRFPPVTVCGWWPPRRPMMSRCLRGQPTRRRPPRDKPTRHRP